MAQTPEQTALTGRASISGQRALLQWIGAVRYPYPSALDRQRAAALSVMSLVFSFLGLWGIIGLAIFFPGAMPLHLIITNLVMVVLFFGVYVLAQTGKLRLGSILFIMLSLLVPILQTVPYQLLNPEIVAMSLVIAILAAAFLLGPAWAFGVFILAAGLVAGSIVLRQFLTRGEINLRTLSMGGGFGPGGPSGQIGFPLFMAEVGFLLFITALFAWLLTTNLAGWARSAQRRAQIMEAAAVVSEAAASAASLRELLANSVNRIRDAYGFYHAQVFLLDQERRMARLEASTGRAGEALLARGHALAVGSQSIIGECTATNQPVVVNNVRDSLIHKPNEMLPDTSAELALPLVVEGQVIGALDVQSTAVNAFQPEDINALQLMTVQLSTAIEKARLLDEVRIRASENEQLYQEAQRSLEQFETLNRQLTQTGWAEYLRTRRTDTLGYTIHDGTLQREETWTAPMRQAMQGQSSVIIRHDQEERAHIAAIPLRVRGEVVGVLEFERGGDRPWGENELTLAEALVDRLAVAVENARLFEQATFAAEREQIVNRIAQEVLEARSIDEVLQSALSDISEVLGASRGMVQISPRVERTTGVAGQQAAQPDGV